MVKAFFACRDRKRPGWVSGISQIAGPDGPVPDVFA